MITPWDHQIEAAAEGIKTLKQHMIVYFAMEERTGKTLAAILVAEDLKIQTVLVITKKKAYKGWIDTLKDFPHEKTYTVTTYQQAHKLVGTVYDLVILDESHNFISGFPKPSKTWAIIVRFTKKKPIILISATPHAQGYAMLYHQFALSTWSPWNQYSSFYNWHGHYGEPYDIYLSGRKVAKYDKVNDSRVRDEIKKFFITKTRKQLGFKQEPNDKIHYIELSDKTKKMYNTLLQDRVLITNDFTLIANTISTLRFALHMMEGGVIKTTSAGPSSSDILLVQRKKNVYDDRKQLLGTLYHSYFNLDEYSKCEYIKKMWGDSSDIVIMYNYIGEGPKLRTFFKEAEILQASSYAEGVDLSHKKHLIIYSQDFSTARHSQRRARQANMLREEEIIVHFILIKKGISEQVYETVSTNKMNYVDSVFTEEEL